MKEQEIRHLEALFGDQPPDSERHAEWQELQALADLLRLTVKTSSEQSVKPYLTERVLRRMAPVTAGTDLFFGALWQLFRPIGVAALLLILGLATYNASLVDAYDVRPTTAEVLLGLQPVTLTTAYASDLESLNFLDP